MIPYLLLFGFFAWGAMLSSPQAQSSPGTGGSPVVRDPAPMLIVGGFLMALLIGLRFEVGGDWRAYQEYWKYAGRVDLSKILEMSDPAYQLLNWLAQEMGLEVWAVNLACGGLFSWGLIRFARTQPLPWLVVVITMPYLVTVVAMGYSRQAVAIGILMAGLASLFRGGNIVAFSFYAILAALFHKTAILVLPLIIFSTDRNRFLSIFGGLVLIYGLYVALLSDDVDNLVQNYVVARYNSQGALIRVVLSLLPALLFLNSRREKFNFDSTQEKFWRLSSLTVLALLVAYFIVPSSTAIDRIALYMFPLQLAVLGRVPLAYPGGGNLGLVIFYSLLVQVVWLNFAVHAFYWTPYQFYPF